MGKYLPIIVTADCGSLTRAGKILGYAQPNMGNIVTRCEKELGVKLFVRSQHGVALTETGEKLVRIMRQIDDMEHQLQEIATRTQKELFRVGVFQSAATQWMPQVVAEFCREYPDTVVQMEHLDHDLGDELELREKRLDCAFFCGTAFPEGVQHIPLILDPFYLLVHTGSPLARLPSVSLAEVAGKYPYIHTNETFDWEESYQDIRQKLIAHDVVKVSLPEDSAAIALVSQGLGVSLLPRLSLCGILPEYQVKAIPLKEALVRTISLLVPKQADQSPLTACFLGLLQKQVSIWEQAQALGSPFNCATV